MLFWSCKISTQHYLIALDAPNSSVAGSCQQAVPFACGDRYTAFFGEGTAVVDPIEDELRSICSRGKVFASPSVEIEEVGADDDLVVDLSCLHFGDALVRKQS